MRFQLLVFAACSVLVVPSGLTAKAERPTRCLILVGWQLQLDPVVAAQLAQRGLTFEVRPLSDPLDLETLSRYPVVVLADLPAVATEDFAPRSLLEKSLATARNLALLPRYVASGGGLFFTPGPTAAAGTAQISEFLGFFGAGAKPMQVRDDAHALTTQYPDRLPDEYAWTTNIKPHATTDDVKRIFYPTTLLRWDGMYSTPVLTFSDPAWKTLVRGMDSSVEATRFGTGSWKVKDRRPVLAAARRYGRGRIFVFAPVAYYTLWQPFADPSRGWIGEAHTGRIAGIVWSKGDGRRGSDVHRLIGNALLWLAEPVPPGESPPSPMTALPVGNPKQAASFPEWLYSWKEGDGSTWFKVLVGARSQYSDGHGTITDYARAARAAGVALLVMTETFESFDPKKWEQFRQDCSRASDRKIQILPGLDIADRYGARYILMNPERFPAVEILSSNGRWICENEYLGLGFAGATTILHRAAGSPIPFALQKHFQGISVFTYRDGKMVDDSLAAYEWQLFHYSNPMPFVVHETYSPEAVKAAAKTGAQLLVSANDMQGLRWYLGRHGMAHFWETPVRMQISSGPVITRFQKSGTELDITISADQPIRDVRLFESGNLYRRWKPNSQVFRTEQVKGPEGKVTWSYLVASDSKGGIVISPGMAWGVGVVHTWRCADRQNWWSYPNIYPGTPLDQFDISLRGTGGAEITGEESSFSNRAALRTPPAPIIEPALASAAAYVEDGLLGQRYRDASYSEVGYDAKPPHATMASTDLRGKVRYWQYFLTNPGRDDFLPMIKEVSLESGVTLNPVGDFAAVFTRLDILNAQVSGDRTVVMRDASTGKEQRTILSQGSLDLPKGGSVGGLIALTDGIRVSADGRVGFAAPAGTTGTVPASTRWQAAFVTVPPEQVERWKAIMGFSSVPLFTIRATVGSVHEMAYVIKAEAEGGIFAGVVDRPLDPAAMKGLTGGRVNRNGEGRSREIGPYFAPMEVSGVNANWPAYSWRPGSSIEAIPVFESRARARINVCEPGPIHVGNVIGADSRDLRIGLLEWTSKVCRIEVNNPTDARIVTSIWTSDDLPGRLKARWQVSLGAGQSKQLSQFASKSVSSETPPTSP